MFLEAIRAALPATVTNLRNPALWLPEALGGGWTSVTGETVSPSTAYSLSTYWAAIVAISSDIASMPLVIYKRLASGGKERMPAHPLYKLLHEEPNNRQGSMDWRQMVTAHALGYGNGYSQIERRPGQGVVALHAIHPSRVRIYDMPDKSLEYGVTSDGQGQKPVEVRISASEMLHVRGLSDDGIQGMSVAKVGCESLGVALANQKVRGRFYANGLSSQVVLKHPEEMSAEALERLRASWASAYQGVDNAYKPVILEEGMDLKELSIAPEDAQLLEGTQFTVEDICRWFRIPPPKVGHLSGATFASIEQLNIAYVVDTLTPWCVRWEQELRRKLFRSEPDVFAEHVVQGLLRGDQKSRGEYYRELFHIGAVSPNDIRSYENQNPIDGGDEYFVPLNMVTVKNAGKMPPPEPEPDPEREPDVGKSQPKPPQEKASVSLIPVARDATLRLLRKDSKAVLRASAKYAGDRDSFVAWLDKFLAEELEYAQEVAAPCLEAAGIDRKAARAFAEWHVGNTRLRVLTAWPGLEAEIDQWEGRSSAMIDRLLGENHD